MENTDSTRYVYECVELTDTVRYHLDLLSMMWLLPQLLRVLTASLSNLSEIASVAFHSRSQWLMDGGHKGWTNLAQCGMILRAHSNTSPPLPGCWPCIVAQCLLLSSLMSCYPLPRELIPGHAIINILNTKLCCRACFPGGLACDAVRLEFSHLACYCVNWFNHLRKLSIVT